MANKRIESVKAKLYKSLLSIDTESHVLPLHFVSLETAEMRRRLDDTPSSTFLPHIKWKNVRATIIKWLKSDGANEWIENELIEKANEPNHIKVLGPFGNIGTLFPITGNPKDCQFIQVVIATRVFTDFYGKTRIDCRIKTIHPTTKGEE